MYICLYTHWIIHDNMEIITYEDYKTRIPYINNAIDIDKMDNNMRGFYFTMYSLYTDYLVNYILKNTSIKDYETRLSNAPLDFKPVEGKDKDFYQSVTGNYLEYFYLRNNIHIENLTKEETQFLSNRIMNDEFDYDEEVEKFIKNTFKRAICEFSLDKPAVMTNYGPDIEKFYVPSNSLVIGFRYDENSIETKDRLNKEQLLPNIINKLQEELSNKLQIQTAIIFYDSFSVKKKNNSVVVK